MPLPGSSTAFSPRRVRRALGAALARPGSLLPTEFEEVWRYRDWVVKAFNDDLPYDQFIIDQIAGDLLPAPSPAA